MSSFGMLIKKHKMSDIYFHRDITLVDGSTLQGDEWQSVPWYSVTSEPGASLKFTGDSFQEFVPYFHV